MIVSGAELQIHQVERSQSRCDEDELHKGVVDADESCEKIQIAADVNDGKENL